MPPGKIDPGSVDAEELVRTINTVMPFGRFKGRKLLELPEPYLVWFHNEGFPRGKLGEQLGLMYEIKLNGLEAMLRPLIKDEVPFSKDEVPFISDGVPSSRDEVPFSKDEVPFSRDEVPFSKDEVPLISDGVPSIKDETA